MLYEVITDPVAARGLFKSVVLLDVDFSSSLAEYRITAEVDRHAIGLDSCGSVKHFHGRSPVLDS